MMARAIGRGALVVALAATVPSATGCAFAIDHPTITTSVVAGTLGLATCKLASDDLAACFAVGASAAAFLGLVTAGAIWLGGDGHTVPTEETAQPLPDDGRPRRPRPVEPVADPAAPAAVEPAAPPADPGAPAVEPAAPAADPGAPPAAPRR